MDCDKCQELIVDLAAGELAGDDERAVAAHAAQCAACRKTLEETRALFAGARAEFALAAPPRIIAAARRRAGASGTSPRVPLWAAAAAVFIAALLAGSSGYFAGKNEEGRRAVYAAVVADSSPGFWKVKAPRPGKVGAAKEEGRSKFWDYRARYDEIKRGT